MGITKSAIRKLEKQIFAESDFIVIPIMSSLEKTIAIKQEAERQGKRTIGIPLCLAEKNNIKLWGLEDLQEAEKGL